MNKIEILAPAKDKETAFAAIDCGADAVYIGAPCFGARKNASNSMEDIKEVVNYAHKFWARVHVTLNTILTDSELKNAVEIVHQLSDIGVDAIIIQDMGLLEELIRESEINKLPQIHISTQCDNYMPEKVKFFNDIGASRVILAREVSIEKIQKIHKENPNLELENFIHGALCVSMSGQCYLSQFIGGRSANRGECAQPCRKKYDVIDDRGNVIAQNIYPLCLKDFNGSSHINELIEAGITSFKIEGRLKDVNYVKNVVAYYSSLAKDKTSSGKSFYKFTPNPEKSFNRGFTDYFLRERGECFNFESPKSKGEYIGKTISANNSYFTLKTNKKLHPQDGLYFNGEGCLINKIIEENGIVKIFPNKKIKIKPNNKIYRNLDTEFEKELSMPVKRQLGLNIFINNSSIKLIDEDNISIEETIPFFEKSNNPEKMKETFIKQLSKTGEEDFYILDIKTEPNTEFPFLPVSEINKLRRDLFNKLMQKRIDTYNKNKKYQNTMKYTEYFKKELDYRANVSNSSAKTFYEKCGAKVIEPAFEIRKPNRQIELMRCKHCIKFALNMCKSKYNLCLRDEKGTIYPLKFNCKECEMSVLSAD